MRAATPARRAAAAQRRRWSRALLPLLGLACALAATAATPPVPSACDALAGAVRQQGSGPVFVASFQTAEPGPLKDVAFLYDNAASSIALIGCGRVDEARQIGDAILQALAHDRHWADGRLRNGYLAGPVTEAPVKLPGWWNATENRWVEDGYQVGSDTGNMAWAMLALLTLYEQTQDPRYRTAAEQIARHVEASLSVIAPSGFKGGTFGFEPDPHRNTWKSTEHNTDIAAAFARLATATGDAHWSTLAQTADSFAAAMFSTSCACFAAGTGEDERTPNPVLALDAQIWPLIALPGAASRFPGVLDMAREKLSHGDGYAYGDAGEGLWTEGTAQTGLLLALNADTAGAAGIAKAIEPLQTPDGWYLATDSTALPTGFKLPTDPAQDRSYPPLPHLGALAWVALFQQRFNPFTGASTLPSNVRP